MIRNSTPTAIEHFVWSKDSNEKDRLIYFDEQGNQFEREIPSEHIEEALKLFDGKKRAIRRSSGGLVLCEPFQLVLFDSEDSKAPRLGIRVKFVDLERSENGVVKSSEPVIHTKIVRASDLHPGFDLTGIDRSAEKIIVEFGRGIIPVHIFGQSLTRGGWKIAHFIVENELLSHAEAPQALNLQIYSAHIEVFRITEHNGERNIDHDVAKDNANWQLNIGEPVIPSCLADGMPLTIPAGTSPEMLRHLLKLSTTQEGRKILEPLVLDIQPGSEENLLPFGIFEP